MIEAQPLFTSVNEFLAGLCMLLALGGMVGMGWLFLRRNIRADD